MQSCERMYPARFWSLLTRMGPVVRRLESLLIMNYGEVKRPKQGHHPHRL